MLPTLLSYLLCWPGTPVLLWCTRAAREPGYVVWSGPLLPLTQPPLPVTCDDCWPIEEPFESVPLKVSVASAKAAVESSEKAATAIRTDFTIFVLFVSKRLASGHR